MPHHGIRVGERGDSCSLAELWYLSARTAHPYLRNCEIEDVANLIIKAYGITELLVMEENNRPSGYMMLHERMIQALYVWPELKFRGVGTRLLEYARANYGVDDCLRVVVHDSSLEGLAFFIKKGFRHEKRSETDSAGMAYISHHLYLPASSGL